MEMRRNRFFFWMMKFKVDISLHSSNWLTNLKKNCQLSFVAERERESHCIDRFLSLFKSHIEKREKQI